MASGSDFVDAPLLKVSRPIAACARCRGAKIKCDGKLPACTACERTGNAESCQTKADQFARGKERSYVASLETQCEKLEKKLDNARRCQQSEQSGSNASQPDQDAATLATTPGLSDKAQRKEASDIDDLVGDFGFLSVNATSRDFHGISSSTSFAGLLLTVAGVKSLPKFPSGELYPVRSQATTLIQYYFDNIYTVLPFLLETKFWTSMDAVYQEFGRFATGFDHWVVRMVLAISLASQSQSAESEQRKHAMGHVCAAIEHAEEVLHPGSISGIQCLLLLAQYSMFDPEHFKTWYLVGMAARVAVDLGLHQEQPSDVYQAQVALDLRRRNFHSVYSLDRYVSCSLGRTFSFSDESIDTPLPASTSIPLLGLATSKPSLFLRDIEPALRLLEVRRLLSDAYQKMFYSSRNPEMIPPVPTWELCSKARNWIHQAEENLPEHVTTQFRLEYYFTLITLLSPSSICPHPSHYNRILTVELAIEFITRQHEIIVNSSFKSQLIVTYMDMERTSIVGNKLVETIESYYTDIFYGPVPSPPSVPQGTPIPPPLSQLVHDRSRFQRQVLASIQTVRSIFEYASLRWAMQTLLEKFMAKSAPVKSILEQEQYAYGAPSFANAAPVEPSLNVRQLATTETMASSHARQESAGYNISPEQPTTVSPCESQ